jgi:hypothetical protein
MPTPRFPIEQWLVPEPAQAPPEGWQLREERLLAGLPHRIELGDGLDLLLVLPTGEAARWREGPGDASLTRAAGERAPAPPADAPAARDLDRVPARLLLRQRGRVACSLPLAAGRTERVSLDDDGRGGPLLELRILDWDLRVGHLRGAGDVGGGLRFAWRRIEQAVAVFSTPPMPPHLRPRIRLDDCLLSVTGLVTLRMPARFTAKQRQLARRKVLR